MKLDLNERLSDGVLLLDGAMGTMFYELGVHLGQCFDALNLSDPDLVQRIHEQYRDAGAQVLMTNSFGANTYKLERHHIVGQTAEINQRAAALAREVAGDDVLVAGCVGPLGVKIEPWGPTSLREARAAFAEQGRALLEGGVHLFVMETFSDPRELVEAIRGVREVATTVPIIANMSVGENMLTSIGAALEDFLPYIEKAEPDAIGLNCTTGPKHMLEAVEKMAPLTRLPICVEPNAGFPKHLEERYFYLSNPDYFARYIQRMVQAGARIVGGCCGTTPAHIKAMKRSLKVVQPNSSVSVKPMQVRELSLKQVTPLAQKSRLGKKLAEGKFVASVELLPPRGWRLNRMLAVAGELYSGGFDTINLPDGPRASARMSPLATAVRIERELGHETVLHYVCRDRNLLGMQADLLGAHTLGIRNLLVITGDPPAQGDYPDVTPVFDVDSIGLTNLVNRLNHGVDAGDRSIGKPTSFLLGVGANPTAISFEKELERFYWKVQAGAEFAVTQPVFDVEPLLHFMDAIKDFEIPIMAGIWPLQSLRNAEFLRNEVPGVTIPDSVMERMRAATGPEAQRETGMRIAIEMAQQVLPRVAGLQISAPFNRGEVAKWMLTELQPHITQFQDHLHVS